MRRWHMYEKVGSDPKMVKEGFNWWAFFFPGFWALYHGFMGLGIFGIAIGAAGGLAGLTGNPDGGIFMGIVSFIVGAVYGINGNAWVSGKLESNGYSRVDTVEAGSREDALVRGRSTISRNGTDEGKASPDISIDKSMDDKFYEAAWSEVETGETKKAVWANTCAPIHNYRMFAAIVPCTEA